MLESTLPARPVTPAAAARTSLPGAGTSNRVL